MASAGVHECGVCWRPYDPAVGDPSRAIPPGTAFEALPEDWRCPDCDAMKVKFLRADGVRARNTARAGPAALEKRAWAATPDGLARSLEDVMRGKALDGMMALPISNPRLRVEAVGFHVWRGARLGVLITPWSMLLIWSPPAPPDPPWPEGLEVEVAFPSGAYDLMPATFGSVGPLLMLPLFSPMDDFDGPDAARAAAKAALLEIMTPPPPRVVDRRALLRGGTDARA
jgi:[NiFe] hydrogenase assembly HybE family chaperone